jgi:hypothetical protein
MRPLLVAALLAATAASAAAQTIHGRVLENGTDRPVAAALVELRVAGEVRAQAQSYEDGSFVLAVPVLGVYRVSATRVGYTPLLSEPFRIQAQDSVALVFHLTSSAVRLSPVEVTGAQRQAPARLAGFYERSQHNRQGRFLTREAIEALGASRTTDLLRRLPGLLFRPTAKGGVAVRGRGGCEPQVYLDGMDISMYRDAISVDDMVQPEDLEGVEVYGSSSIPVEYVRNTPGNQCGAVMFWTRSSL